MLIELFGQPTGEELPDSYTDWDIRSKVHITDVSAGTAVPITCIKGDDPNEDVLIQTVAIQNTPLNMHQIMTNARSGVSKGIVTTRFKKVVLSAMFTDENASATFRAVYQDNNDTRINIYGNTFTMNAIDYQRESDDLYYSECVTIETFGAHSMFFVLEQISSGTLNLYAGVI